MSSTVKTRDDHSIIIAPADTQQIAGSVDSQRDITRATLVAAVVFLATFLFLNRALFRQPIYEWGDSAANALQIQNAKHFRELLGNYSRWGFHHPGPAFFYMFAAGEWLFHDLLHIVPQPMNACVLTIVLVNVLFLFSSIWIVGQHRATPLFVPIAALSSFFLIEVINRTVSLDMGRTETALSSVWMPNVLLFCFLLYLVSCAAVASGEIRYLPLVTLTGLMLLHAHVAQLLFVGALSLILLAKLVWDRRHRSLRPLLKNNKKELITCCVLIAVFATPPLLDVLLHKPNNIDAIHTYMRDQVGLPNSLRQAVRYELSFFTFLANPDKHLGPSPVLFAQGGSHPYVLEYWAFIMFLLGTLAGLRIRGPINLPPFTKYLVMELLVVCVLFLYWTMKMAGGLSNFNGYFFYSIQFAAIFCLLSLILPALTVARRRISQVSLVMSCLAPCIVFASVPQFMIPVGGGEFANQVATAAQGRAPMIQIVFGHDDWPTAIGVASRLRRAGQPFCVAPSNLMFGRGATCHDLSHILRLVLTHDSAACAEPCQVLLQTQGLAAELSPYPQLRLPFTLKTDALSGLFEGFNTGGPEGAPMWTTEQASIRFLTGESNLQGQKLRITVEGFPRRDVPVEIRLNTNLLGSIQYGQAGAVHFVVPGDWLKGSSENTITFSAPKAGPAGEDVRHMGFLLESISFDRIGS